MGKRRPKFRRYGRKRELYLIKMLFDKPKNHQKPIVPAYIPPDLVLRGDDCEECGGQIVYHMRWDAACCPSCNEWKEEKCSDPDCMFCPNRPESPLTFEEWQQWRAGELVARELIAPTEQENKRWKKQTRRHKRLKANRKEKRRGEKRGIKWRNKAWRRKREKGGTLDNE